MLTDWQADRQTIPMLKTFLRSNPSELLTFTWCIFNLVPTFMGPNPAPPGTYEHITAHAASGIIILGSDIMDGGGDRNNKKILVS
jgi:hypothetical protein